MSDKKLCSIKYQTALILTAINSHPVIGNMITYETQHAAKHFYAMLRHPDG